MIKCLLTEFRSGRTGKYLALGYGCARSVRYDLGPNIFASGPPTQSISTYYCPSKLMEKRASSELLYKSNRPQVSMVCRHDKPLGMLEEHSKNS